LSAQQEQFRPADPVSSVDCADGLQRTGRANGAFSLLQFGAQLPDVIVRGLYGFDDRIIQVRARQQS
jgi:hypothetical protein